jgi:hypothetical protein
VLSVFCAKAENERIISNITLTLFIKQELRYKLKPIGGFSALLERATSQLETF